MVDILHSLPYRGSVIDTVQLSPAAIVETFPNPLAEAVFTPDVCKLLTPDISDAEAERLFHPLLHSQPT